MIRARSATSIIWSTVVSAAAMLGTAGCHHDAAKPITPVVEAPPLEEDTVQPAPPVEEPPAASRLDEEPPVVAAPAMVKVAITTQPDGAQVYRDGMLAGVTPLMLAVAASDEPMELQVMLAGYQPKQLVVKPSSDQQLSLTLTKAARVRGTGSGKKTGRGFILS